MKFSPWVHEGLADLADAWHAFWHRLDAVSVVLGAVALIIYLGLLAGSILG